MIEEIMRLLREQGVVVPDAVRQDVEVRFRYEYAGERVYVKGLPKQRRAVQIARLEMRSAREMSVASGLPLRTVQRLRSGR